MSNPILVTGATGNVGREVVAALLRAGRRVRAAVPQHETEQALARWGPPWRSCAKHFVAR